MFFGAAARALVAIVRSETSERRRYKELEEITGIPASNWQSAAKAKQRPTVAKCARKNISVHGRDSLLRQWSISVSASVGCWLVSNKKSSHVACGISRWLSVPISFSHFSQVRRGCLDDDTRAPAESGVSPARSLAARTSSGRGTDTRSAMGRLMVIREYLEKSVWIAR
jgi:hypothetical protein